MSAIGPLEARIVAVEAVAEATESVTSLWAPAAGPEETRSAVARAGRAAAAPARAAVADPRASVVEEALAVGAALAAAVAVAVAAGGGHERQRRANHE